MALIDRSYSTGGRSIRAQELSGIFAAQAHDHPRVAADLATGGYGPVIAPTDLPSGTAEALGRAGWTFIRPDAADLQTLTGKPGVNLCRVILTDDGVCLDNGGLCVRFAESTSGAECRAALAGAGLEVVRPLFLPNLFKFRTSPGDSAFAAAAMLARNPRVLYAEVDLIAPLGPR